MASLKRPDREHDNVGRLYAQIEPYARGLLDVGDGNAMYWECCGNPSGIPAVYVHGGPGSGCTSGARRVFDPSVYRIILFDQRGCGRSRPLVDDRRHLQANTTQHLVGDMEALRRHAAVDRWLVVGASWGTTLALAYAQSHAEFVSGLVLASVTTTSRREVDWLTGGVGRIFPREFERFASHVPERFARERIVDAYAELLFEEASVSAAAADEWCAWEDSHVSLVPGYRPNPRFRDPGFRLRFARLVTHYWRHAAFLDDEQLIRDAALLNGISGTLIHGRYDVSSPLETAYRLHERWNGSELQVVDEAGHTGDAIAETVVRALDRDRTVG